MQHIITVIDEMGFGGAVSIDASDFTEAVSSWFDFNGEPQMAAAFHTLAEAVTAPAWDDEVHGEAARLLGLSIKEGAPVAELEIGTDAGEIDENDEFHTTDTITITAPESGTELDHIHIPASENAEAYDRAAADAGFHYINWN